MTSVIMNPAIIPPAGSIVVMKGGVPVIDLSGLTLSGDGIVADSMTVTNDLAVGGDVSITGAVEVEDGDLTVTAGDVTITNGALTAGGGAAITGGLEVVDTGLTVTAGGATVSDGTVTIAETGAPALVVSGAPQASATVALVRLGNAIAGGSASGTFLGMNAANGYAGNLADLQVNGSSVFKVTATGALTFGSVSLGATAATARSALVANVLTTSHYFADMRAATAMFRHFSFGAAGFLAGVVVTLDAAIDADASLTVTIDGVAVTFASTTIVAAGSGEGTTFSFTPTGGNSIPSATSRIKVTVGGANTNNVGATITCRATY